MKTPSTELAGRLAGEATVRVAAAGDVHCDEQNRDAVVAAFRSVADEVNLILLAGDLTTHGEPEQAQVLADAVSGVEVPVIAVLGNHDLHVGRRAELLEVLSDAGIVLLDAAGQTHALCADGVGVAGVKGFVGGFRGMGLPDFGEPSLRGIYAETTAEVNGLSAGLAEIAACPLRIVLLHYAPVQATLEGEPSEIWTFLGSDRLAAPLLEHRPDLVLHGHAHAGTFEGDLDGVPVYNVSVPVMRRDFWVFEVAGSGPTSSAVH
jgi:uncharacterized protein